eukprot:TRINITY_DN4015_c0_g1_i1.p1 TRINITY_DN4015_c0_g1~~TRINITY_DN4015_c0_g1_i1.p1  ORF type:complete len:190 (-),score=16.99 TRINITY_DN4015_c0_g1_i1:238-807(-)
MAAFKLVHASILASSTSFSCSVSRPRPSLPSRTQFNCHLRELNKHTPGLERDAFSGNAGPTRREDFSITFSARKRGDGSNIDDEGVIRDMERYLEDLSLEYDSVWDTKPAWCQPWSILLTGSLAIIGSWALLKTPLVTGALSLVIAAWWWIFLYSYPLAYSEMIEERRRKIQNGDEDTFGREKVNGVIR